MKKLKKKNKAWTILSTKQVYENPYFLVAHDEVVLPDQSIGNFFVIHTKKGSGKSAYIITVKDDEIFFIKQYRYASHQWHIEIPGGSDSEKSLLELAKAELRGELGYKAKKWKELGHFVPWPGPSSEQCHVFLARDLEYVGQKLDDGEEKSIKVLPIKIKKAYEMLDNGKFQDGQTMAALILARKYLIKNKS